MGRKPQVYRDAPAVRKRHGRLGSGLTEDRSIPGDAAGGEALELARALLRHRATLGEPEHGTRTLHRRANKPAAAVPERPLAEKSGLQDQLGEELQAVLAGPSWTSRRRGRRRGR